MYCQIISKKHLMQSGGNIYGDKSLLCIFPFFILLYHIDRRYSYKRRPPPPPPPTHVGKLFLVETPQGCHICFIIPNKIQNTKGGQITNTTDFGMILVVCLVELVSPVGHSTNSVGVRGYSSG